MSNRALLGMFKQLVGGASTWITLAIFLFSGLAAWNTPTMGNVRDALPWLNLAVFIGLIVLGLGFAMWFEYKYVQPSIMLYWNKLHFDNGNPLIPKLDHITAQNDVLNKRLAELERKLEALTAGLRENSTE